jgi:hypothetical protein
VGCPAEEPGPYQQGSFLWIKKQDLVDKSNKFSQNMNETYCI